MCKSLLWLSFSLWWWLECLSSPYGLCLAGHEVYVSGCDSHLTLLSSIWQSTETHGESGQGPGQLNHPFKLCLDDSDLFIADSATIASKCWMRAVASSSAYVGQQESTASDRL